MTFLPTTDQNGYIALPVAIDPNALVKAALLAIMAQLPAYIPREGHLDVAIIEESGQMMSETAVVASKMAPAAFMDFGQLVGITPELGTRATVPVTFTLRTTAGLTIPAGTIVSYPVAGNIATTQLLFTVQSDIVIPNGSSTGTGTLICETVGTFANALPPATCQLVTTMASVASVATTATSSGGVNAETANAYLNRLSNELQLLAPRPIRPSDFAGMARNVSGVYRALAINGLNPGRSVANCTTTSSSKTVTAAAGAFTSLDVGRPVTGSGIPATTVISTVLSSTQVKLSKTATASSTTATLTFGDLRTQERFITVCGLTTTGTALTTAENSAMQSYLASKREVNFVVATVFPTFTSIDVSVNCDAVSGVPTATVQSAITAALQSFLNPATWGGGNAQVPQWSPTAGTVRFLDVANVIRTTQGVLYIPSTGLKIAIHGNSLGTADVVLPGDAPLPRVGTLNVVVTAS